MSDDSQAGVNPRSLDDIGRRNASEPPPGSLRMVQLDDDIAEAFDTAAEVNDALREYLREHATRTIEIPPPE